MITSHFLTGSKFRASFACAIWALNPKLRRLAGQRHGRSALLMGVLKSSGRAPIPLPNAARCSRKTNSNLALLMACNQAKQVESLTAAVGFHLCSFRRSAFLNRLY